MMVSDLALRMDPGFSAIAESWVDDFQALTDNFAAAWCKYPVPHHCCHSIFTDS